MESTYLTIVLAPLAAATATLPTLDEDFPPIEDVPAEPVDL